MLPHQKEKPVGEQRPKLSVVVIFHNMRREALRTLYTLTATYQVNISVDDYEVIAVDSDSTEPLDASAVTGMQENFFYRRVHSDWPSPCRAMNTGIHMARADYVVCMIDGARMLSPGVLSRMMQVNKAVSNAFTQTIAFHLGREIQNVSVSAGYNQDTEDILLSTIDWKTHGYSLFDIACLAGSSKKGFLSPIPESNCFCVRKNKLEAMGGFDERFRSSGGGIVNFDVLNTIMSDSLVQPVMLLGEASFHQFHGGVATNVPWNLHPMEQYQREYQDIRGVPYQARLRTPLFFGDIRGETRRFLCGDNDKLN